MCLKLFTVLRTLWSSTPLHTCTSQTHKCTHFNWNWSFTEFYPFSVHMMHFDIFHFIFFQTWCCGLWLVIWKTLHQAIPFVHLLIIHSFNKLCIFSIAFIVPDFTVNIFNQNLPAAEPWLGVTEKSCSCCKTRPQIVQFLSDRWLDSFINLFILIYFLFLLNDVEMGISIYFSRHMSMVLWRDVARAL